MISKWGGQETGKDQVPERNIMVYICFLATHFDKISADKVCIINRQRVLSQEGLKWKN